MRISSRHLASILLVALLSACSKPHGSEFVGSWEPVKPGSAPAFQISKDGDTFTVVDNNSAKYTATYNTNAHVLNMSAQGVIIPFSYVASTDHLSAMGDEFKRATSDGPATAASGGKKPSLDDQAVAYGKTLYAGKMIVCDGRSFANLSTSSPGFTHLAELKNPAYSSDSNDADAGDKLNGIDYTGDIRMTWDAYRVLDKGKWTEWFGAGNGRYDLDIQGFELIRVVHKNGQWQYAKDSDFLSARKKPLTCAAIPAS